MAVRISSSLLTDILARAAASPDVEVCGLLFGDADRIHAARPAPNVAADPARAFEVDPAALFAASRAERTGGPRLIGYYHSHPNGDATPSSRDIAAGERGKLWLIVGGGAARSWRVGKGSFAEVALIVD